MRNNVFKLSGNMALGGENNYGYTGSNNDLKDKKKSRNKYEQPQMDDYLGKKTQQQGSYSSKQYRGMDRQPKKRETLNYKADILSQHQIPNSHKNLRSNQKPNEYQYTDSKGYGRQEPEVKRSKVPPRMAPKKEAYKPETFNYDQYQDLPREKPIKQLKKENQLDIVEYDPSQFKLCSKGCGRKFNPESIAKHEKICVKVFQKKRKEFNIQEQRMVEKEQKKMMKKGEVVQKKIEKQKEKEGVQKWKADSVAFRAILKQNRGGKKVELTEAEKKMIKASQDSSMTKCHICGRSFSDQAAKRHIPFCQSQAKKNAMKRKK